MAIRWRCEGVILERSVMAWLRIGGSGRLDEKARQGLDDDPFLLVVELVPQVRLRNRDVVEAQNQLGHGPPGLSQILLTSRRCGGEEHRRGRKDAAGRRASRRAEEAVACRRWPCSLSSRQGSATCFRPVE